MFGVGASACDCRWCVAESPADTLGNIAPRCASTLSCATLSAAFAAFRSGLLASACSIRAFRGFEWNRVHHSPEISAPFVKRWTCPPGASEPERTAGSGWPVKSWTSGGAGDLNVGPTAQPASSSETATDVVTPPLLMTSKRIESSARDGDGIDRSRLLNGARDGAVAAVRGART